jgi:hypothetical protein
MKETTNEGKYTSEVSSIKANCTVGTVSVHTSAGNDCFRPVEVALAPPDWTEANGGVEARQETLAGKADLRSHIPSVAAWCCHLDTCVIR